MPVSTKQNQQLDAVGMKERGLPWFNNVEQHWVRNVLPYIECIRAFKLGDPYGIKVI
jgi:hypothetical protein